MSLLTYTNKPPARGLTFCHNDTIENHRHEIKHTVRKRRVNLALRHNQKVESARKKPGSDLVKFGSADAVSVNVSQLKVR